MGDQNRGESLMDAAKKGDAVKLTYTARSEGGTEWAGPVQFTIGSGEVIEGLDEAVVGMRPGETKTEVVSAERAFGPRVGALVQEVAREVIPADVDVAVDQRVTIRRSDGQTYTATIIACSDDLVTFDANHPLAGEALTLDIRLEEIL